MSVGEQEHSKCDVCGQEGIVSRKYYYYDVKCECCSPQHAEIVRYCKNCTPKAPRATTVLMKPSKICVLCGREDKLTRKMYKDTRTYRYCCSDCYKGDPRFDFHKETCESEPCEVQEYDNCKHCGHFGTMRKENDGPLLCFNCHEPATKIQTREEKLENMCEKLAAGIDVLKCIQTAVTIEGVEAGMRAITFAELWKKMRKS